MKNYLIKGITLLLVLCLCFSAIGCRSNMGGNSSDLGDSSENGTGNSTGKLDLNELINGGNKDNAGDSKPTIVGDNGSGTNNKGDSQSNGKGDSQADDKGNSNNNDDANDDSNVSMVEKLIKKPTTNTTNWRQKEFYISTLWPYEYRISDVAKRKEVLKLCKDGGLNLVELGIVESGKEEFSYCDQIGLNYLVKTDFTRGIGTWDAKYDVDTIQSEVNKYKAMNNKNMIGYLIWDEMPQDSFEIGKTLHSNVNKFDPDRLAYSCLFPSYGPYTWQTYTGNPEDSAYYKYVDSYINTVKPQLISFDYYTFMHDRSNNILTREWYKDMGLFRLKSAEYDLPFWFYVGSVDNGSDGKPTITEPQVNVQHSVAMAYGAKAIAYFTTTNFMYDIVTGEKLAQYDWATKINNRTMKMGQFLFDKEPVAIYHTGFSKYNSIQFLLDNIEDSKLIKNAPSKLIISEFKDKSGAKYIMVVPKTITRAQNGTITLKSNKMVAEYDKTTGTLGNAVSTNKIEFNVEAGGAAIFQVK